MNVRFLPGRRLKLEDGTTLDVRGGLLTNDEATASLAGSRVLLYSYPEVTDITADSETVQDLIGRVRTKPRIGEYSAQLYASGSRSVLVLDHFH